MKCICSKSKACLLFGATRLIRHACRKAIDIVTLASEYIVCLSWQYQLFLTPMLVLINPRSQPGISGQFFLSAD